MTCFHTFILSSNLSMKTPKSFFIIHSILCLLFFMPCDSDASCMGHELKALLEFKKRVIDESNSLASWVGSDCCSWDGVGCEDNTSNVRSLVLDERGLGGEINPSLSNLTHLDTLDLPNNNFSGTLPTSIGQLVMLRWLKVSYNSLTGTLPTSIGQLVMLSSLDVSYNLLTGTLPTSIGQLVMLQSLDVSNNSLTGLVSELHFAKLSNLRFLYLESNYMLEWNVSSKWVPHFQLHDIYLDSCRLGPKFPPWLENQRLVSDLSLRNTSITTAIPGWFEKSVLPTIEYLDLSYNGITGKVFEFQKASRVVLLNSNRFEILFKRFPLTTGFIDLSNNLLTGQLPRKYHYFNQSGTGYEFGTNIFFLSNNQLSGPIPKYLCLANISLIDLSKNQLSGELPSCLGGQKHLILLDLSSNNLDGEIPNDFFSSKSKTLISLHLNNNRFRGKVPSSLQNLWSLELIDISGNLFSDNIPPCLGSLVRLKALNLESNKFYGHIPQTLCGLSHLRVLNLPQNNLTGKIPSCFGNFTGMTTNISTSYLSVTDADTYSFEEHINSLVKGTDRSYTSTLRYLMSIDLSGNSITGEIPTELVSLIELQNMNLSGNCLHGNIPEKIGHMHKLESLDLSRNQLSGNIPLSMSNLNFLSYLNLSYNNLSGRIPGGSQLQTFDDPSSFMGNQLLCGQQIKKSCPDEKGQSTSQAPKNTGKNADHGEDSSDGFWFYAGMGPGLFVGLVGFCTILLYKNSWSYRYFLFLENCYLWLVSAVEAIFRRRG